MYYLLYRLQAFTYTDKHLLNKNQGKSTFKKKFILNLSALYHIQTGIFIISISIYL